MYFHYFCNFKASDKIILFFFSKLTIIFVQIQLKIMQIKKLENLDQFVERFRINTIGQVKKSFQKNAKIYLHIKKHISQLLTLNKLCHDYKSFYFLEKYILKHSSLNNFFFTLWNQSQILKVQNTRLIEKINRKPRKSIHIYNLQFRITRSIST